MKPRKLVNKGFPENRIIGMLVRACIEADKQGVTEEQQEALIDALKLDPKFYREHPIFGEAARFWDESINPQDKYKFEDKAYRVFGPELLDQNTLDQMANCMRLPVAVAGAIMPDGHLGYGLPIGGVLATEGAVIPYAVGVDIACRMMMSIIPTPVIDIDKKEERFVDAIERNTRFGVGSSWTRSGRRQHPVMDMDWDVTKITGSLKDLAWEQMGTSGGGNHFVDIVEVTFDHEFNGLAPGTYVAIVSHSGSRGVGSKTAEHYFDLAKSHHPSIPAEYRHLGWLDMAGDGQEYWAAMELMGEYASANHHVIHRSIMKGLGVEPLLQIENHHNFAWKEMHGGKEVIVHRKGATPAGLGVMGIIPGSMATAGFVVRGKGKEESLNSASHGAGRSKSRKATKESNTWNQVKGVLKERRVKLISGGLDEVPNAYKRIETVIGAQTDLVDIVAKFVPRIVKMADDGTAED